jgi:hypothetical protein
MINDFINGLINYFEVIICICFIWEFIFVVLSCFALCNIFEVIIQLMLWDNNLSLTEKAKR